MKHNLKILIVPVVIELGNTFLCQKAYFEMVQNYFHKYEHKIFKSNYYKTYRFSYNSILKLLKF